MSSILLNVVLSLLSIRVLTMPFVGVLVYYWLSIMNPQRLVYGGPDIRWSFIITLIMLFAVVVSKEKFKLKVNSVFISVTFFYLWTCMSTLFSVFSNASELWFDFSKTILVFMLTIMLTKTKVRLNALIWVFVISGSVYILREGAYLVLTGGSHLITGPPKSPYFGNNDLARLLGISFPFLLFLAYHSKNLLSRKVLWVIALLDLVTIIGSQSRGALVALLAMGCYLFFKSNRKGTLTFILLFFSGVFVTLISGSELDKFSARYSTIDDYDEDKSFQGRLFAWEYGYEVAKKNPLLGHGFGAFQGATMIYSGEGSKLKGEKKAFIDAHSIYFEAMGEHGFVGLLFFLSTGISAFFRARWIEKLAKKSVETYWQRDLAIVIQAALVFYFVGGVLISHTYLDIYYLVLALTIILDRQMNQFNDLDCKKIESASKKYHESYLV